NGLGQLARSAEEITAYDEVVTRFGDTDDLPLRECVAMAMVNKGDTLGQMGRFAEAITFYEEVVTRYGEDPAPVLREAVTEAREGLRKSGRHSG
ncbi:MAG: hypothetical protein QOK26_1603, partial [Pseudonocardiales bacterium]|nr:hypothetical protein [Pseudonocardiales bacterium]